MPYKMHLFRRPPHYIFEPALLLDLAVLVLVGTILVINIPRTAKQTVMEITVPQRPSLRPAHKYSVRFEVPPPAELRRMRNWHTTELTGLPHSDSVTMQLFRRQLIHMLQFPDNANGVSIRFGSQAHYGSLVEALDELQQLEVKKYLLDVYSPVMAIYALTDSYQSPRPRTDFEVSSITAPTAPDSASSATTRWMQQVAHPLQHAAWGTALLACAGVAVVGGVVWLLKELT